MTYSPHAAPKPNATFGVSISGRTVLLVLIQGEPMPKKTNPRPKPGLGTPSPTPLQTRWIPTGKSAWNIAICYAFLGALWILGSGWLLHHLVKDGDLEAEIETLKGWFYVLITAALLGLALQRYFKHIRRFAQQLQESQAQLQLVADNLPGSYVYQYVQTPDGKGKFIHISAGV
jgi:hypothetical protein